MIAQPALGEDLAPRRRAGPGLQWAAAELNYNNGKRIQIISELPNQTNRFQALSPSSLVPPLPQITVLLLGCTGAKSRTVLKGEDDHDTTPTKRRGRRGGLPLANFICRLMEFWSGSSPTMRGLYVYILNLLFQYNPKDGRRSPPSATKISKFAKKKKRISISSLGIRSLSRAHPHYHGTTSVTCLRKIAIKMGGEHIDVPEKNAYFISYNTPLRKQ